MIKTVVELDLVGYSTIGDNLEQALDVNSAAQLNQQIQSFVDAGLTAVNVLRDEHVMQTTGDGAILVFDTAFEAHRFAHAVHEATREHNRTRQQPLAKRVFRIGAASGEIVMQPKAGGGFDIAGSVIARAVRLEAKAQPGGLLVDQKTFEALGPEGQQLYGPKQMIPGKRDEVFAAHAWQPYSDGPADAAFFIKQKQEAAPEPITRRFGTDQRRELLERFGRLKSHQYHDLIFLLEIPIDQRPPDTVNLAQQRTQIMTWAEEDKRLDFLLDELRRMTEPPDAVRPRVGSSEVGATPMSQLSSAERIINADISRIIKYAPSELIGREAETKLLKNAWAKVSKASRNRPRVLTFVALGGEGKTSLVADWAVGMQLRAWPGCDAVFAWSFYSQGTREQLAASSDLFLKEALIFFGDDADKQFAASPAGAFEKGQRLARIVASRRSLLILDGLEPLQYAPTSPTPGQLKDQGIAALLKGLAAGNHGLCVVTTRYSLPDLKAFWQTSAPEVKLLRLSREAGVHLLKILGVKGSERRTLLLKDGDENSERVNEFEKLVEDVKRHALTLTLLGSYLNEAHGGDIRKRNLVNLEEADDEIEVIPDHPHHAFHVMDAYVEWFETGGKSEEENEKGLRALAVLRLLGLFDRPATADSLNALWKGEAIAGLTEPLVDLTDAQRNTSLKRLDDANLLTVNRDPSGALVSLDAHPHLREYFARQLRAQKPDGWRGAHRQLYEHLCATTKEGDQPTLEDLQPLYQAVAHGCQAGLQEEAYNQVYFGRIRRGNAYYSVKNLGAFGADLGAVGCFFDQPWSRISPSISENSQAVLLNAAAFFLRALGRLTEALDPMRAGLKSFVKQENWESAAVLAGNLSELDLTLGEVAGAVVDAEQSVIYADRCDVAFQRLGKRTTQGDVLHQAGLRAEAEACLREAERIQTEYQPDYPVLYSVQGFRHCELLLTGAEHIAWKTILQVEIRNPELETAVVSCRAVSERAAQTLKWYEQERGVSLLTIALDHLTLGRAALYKAILEKSEIQSPKSEIYWAVDGLRRSDSRHHIPRGLLTRAWLLRLNGRPTGPESAQEDLDEAWEIAERGPMRLFMADIHLYRARLFHGVKSYPWTSPQEDLAAARKLIEQCGYWRRKEELEDAEEAAKNW